MEKLLSMEKLFSREELPGGRCLTVKAIDQAPARLMRADAHPRHPPRARMRPRCIRDSL